MTTQILYAADLAPSPWKNGGGVTCELAVSPLGADLDSFDWRVSMATVATGGAFSTFQGVDRLMLVLEGELELAVAGATKVTLSATGAAAGFPGDAVVAALTPAAPVIDLNVMVRRGRFNATIERRRIEGAGAVVCQDVTLILCRSAGLIAESGTDRYELGPDDVLRIDGARGGLARLRLTGDIVVAHINSVR